MGKGGGTSDWQRDPRFREHYDAFVRVFICAQRRDRFLLKPMEGLGSICHQLRQVLRDNHAVSISTSIPSAVLAAELTRRSLATQAIGLSCWSGATQEATAEALIEEIDHGSGGAGASLAPGAWVYVRGEYPGNAEDRFVLVADKDDLASFSAWAAKAAKKR
jgi:hypothetical protein